MTHTSPFANETTILCDLGNLKNAAPSMSKSIAFPIYLNSSSWISAISTALLIIKILFLCAKIALTGLGQQILVLFLVLKLKIHIYY
jgi:hypothetical protein